MECADLESGRTHFEEWKHVPSEKFAPDPNDTKKYPLEIELQIVVYNHDRWIDQQIDDEELRFHIGQARKAFHQCNIEVTAADVRYLKGPRFLGSLTENEDGVAALSRRERCLLSPTFETGLLNLYFVDNVPTEGSTTGTSHALTESAFRNGEYRFSTPEDRSFIGTAIITDASRRSTIQTGQVDSAGHPITRANPAQKVVVPHELAHILTNEGHTNSFGPNLMNAALERADLSLTPAQCQKAQASPFVRPRKEVAPAKIMAAPSNRVISTTPPCTVEVIAPPASALLWRDWPKIKSQMN